MTLCMPYRTGTVRLTSRYGTRTLEGVTEMHKGVDLCGTDKTIVAPCAGRVGWAGLYDDSASGGRTHEWGNYVRIETDGGYAVYLCHLDSVSVRAGQDVSAGDVLGIEGNTGSVWPKPTSAADKTSGRHLHFEVRYAGKSLDPTPLLGIANRVGSYPAEADYAALVCARCGLEPQTRAYLDQYKYAADLWRKLWEAME